MFLQILCVVGLVAAYLNINKFLINNVSSFFSPWLLLSFSQFSAKFILGHTFAFSVTVHQLYFTPYGDIGLQHCFMLCSVIIYEKKILFKLFQRKKKASTHLTMHSHQWQFQCSVLVPAKDSVRLQNSNVFSFHSAQIQSLYLQSPWCVSAHAQEASSDRIEMCCLFAFFIILA